MKKLNIFLILGLMSAVPAWAAGPSYMAIPQMEWAMNGDRFFLLSPTGDLEVFNQSGDSVWKPIEKVGMAKFSPDGTRVAYTSSAGLMVYVFSSRQSSLLSAIGTDELLTDMQWSPSGQKVSFWKRAPSVGNDIAAELCLVTVSGGEKKSLASRHQARMESFPLEPEKKAKEIRDAEENEKLMKARQREALEVPVVVR